MSFETIRVDHEGGIAVITLNRPEKLNAWTPVMGREMTDAFRAAFKEKRPPRFEGR